MKPKMILRLITDVGMTIALLLLMAYKMIGHAAHEWIGIGMFLLFILHHILNKSWSRNLLRGRYTPLRIVQTISIVLVLFTMLGAMVSGVILSRHAFSFLQIKGDRSFAKSLHMLSAYWGLVFLSLHLGFHWRMVTEMAEKLWGKSSDLRKWICCLTAALIAGYGTYAFSKRNVGSYMLLRNQFVSFDCGEPIVFFLLDYLAIMGLFVFLGHYFCEYIRRNNG